MSTGTILFAALGAVVMWAMVAFFVVGVNWLGRRFEERDQRDRARAHVEGFEAASQGKSAASNPYMGERGEYFQGMAAAWRRGFEETNG
jgi:ribosome modulation factor